jgi:hypothetical protein
MNRRDHGDGGIDERSPGHYRLRYRVGGKRFAKSFHGSIAEARKELRRLIKSADDGAHVAPDKLTLAGWVDRWLALLRRDEDTGGRSLVNLEPWNVTGNCCGCTLSRRSASARSSGSRRPR